MGNARPLLVGPDSGPETPFPLQMEGKVIKGFGRGSKELGIPTANLPVDTTPWIKDAKSGVYFGWASLELPTDHPDHHKTTTTSASLPPTQQQQQQQQEKKYAVFPMVMSIGYNPFYNNTVRSAEVHVLDNFGADFYGVEMRLLILGYIRDEQSYDGVEALIEDIKTDCEVARRSLDREGWRLQGTAGGKFDGSWLTR
ncbi:riboflavin kinase [Cryphonectria parasitica EP155]|uniref:Riboflavin kinase n=1 Tax=Cryphonectria parasitica (strain ATCC 38755 / EP155) TaxID=660469 RepID=A0A9P4XUH5_CRYP1|nr:riboflavin kinase [Cryphonectria parasitica EP155]KAF3761527.1 riboflavin kinase [Cryphonectria parasitica EP155]